MISLVTIIKEYRNVNPEFVGTYKGKDVVGISRYENGTSVAHSKITISAILKLTHVDENISMLVNDVEVDAQAVDVAIEAIAIKHDNQLAEAVRTIYEYRRDLPVE